MNIMTGLVTTYVLIGFAMSAMILMTTIKYEREIEKEIGEKIEEKNVKILMILSAFTWPIKVIQFIRIVAAKIEARYEIEKQSREG